MVTGVLHIQEGRKHQVRLMLQAVDRPIFYLKRIAFAGLTLDPDLKPGEYRPLTPEERLRLGVGDPKPLTNEVTL